MVFLRRMLVLGVLAFACAAVGGCKVKQFFGGTFTSVEHFQADADGVQQGDRDKALITLRSWLVGRGYKRLTSQTDIDAVTTWAARGAKYEEVWQGTLDPAEPKSMFVLRVIEDVRSKMLLICLTAQRSGDEDQLKQQSPVADKERDDFFKMLDTFPWLKQEEDVK